MLNLIDSNDNSTTIDAPVKKTFVLKNVVTIQKISYDEVWVEAENETQAQEFAVAALQNNEWLHATDPMKGEIDIVDVDSVTVSDDVEDDDTDDVEDDDTDEDDETEVPETPVVSE